MDLRFKCALCGSEFVVSTETYQRFDLGSIPTKCPTCKDVGKALASDAPKVGTVVDRRCLGFWPCILVGHEVYDRLEAAPTRRGTVGRGAFCGRDFGEVVWHGRLDVWDHRPGNAPYPVEQASVRLMVAEKVVGVTGRGTAVWSATSELAPEVVGHRTESYRYLVLGEPRGGADPGSRPAPAGRLRAIVRSWKTTLKGFGRQISSRYHISENVVEIARYGGQCRTGRLGSEGLVAVIPHDEYVAIEGWSDGSDPSYLVYFGSVGLNDEPEKMSYLPGFEPGKDEE